MVNWVKYILIWHGNIFDDIELILFLTYKLNSEKLILHD